MTQISKNAAGRTAAADLDRSGQVNNRTLPKNLMNINLSKKDFLPPEGYLTQHQFAKVMEKTALKMAYLKFDPSDQPGIISKVATRNVTRDKSYNKNMQGYHFIPLPEGMKVEDIERKMEQYLGNNDIDEALVKGDDGRYYLVFADDMTSDFNRNRARFEHTDEKGNTSFSGEIVKVQREIDGKDLLIRGAGYTAAAGLVVGGVLLVGATPAMPITGTLAVGAGIGVGAYAENRARETERDLTGFAEFLKDDR